MPRRAACSRRFRRTAPDADRAGAARRAGGEPRSELRGRPVVIAARERRRRCRPRRAAAPSRRAARHRTATARAGAPGPPGWIRRPRSRRTSATIRSASCVSASRAMSGPKARDTNAAARAVTPRPRARHGCARVAATASASDASLSTAWVSSSSCRPRRGQARARRRRARPAARRPRAASRTVRCSSRAGASRGRLGAVERGILQQHAGLQLLERGRGLEPERLDQGGASRPEHLERLGLPAGAVERDHQLAAQALVERMLASRALRARARARRRGRARARHRGTSP